LMTRPPPWQHPRTRCPAAVRLSHRRPDLSRAS
jgi:hypothetical protein